MGRDIEGVETGQGDWKDAAWKRKRERETSMQVGQSVKLVVSVHLILVSTFALRMTGRTINEFASSSEATRRFSLPLPPFHPVFPH